MSSKSLSASESESSLSTTFFLVDLVTFLTGLFCSDLRVGRLGRPFLGDFTSEESSSSSSSSLIIIDFFAFDVLDGSTSNNSSSLSSVI